MGYNAVSIAVSNVDISVSKIEKLLSTGEYYNRQITSINDRFKYIKNMLESSGTDYDKICGFVRECELALKNLCIAGKNLDSSFPNLTFPNVEMSFKERFVPGGLKGFQVFLAGAAAAGAALIGLAVGAAVGLGTAAVTTAAGTTLYALENGNYDIIAYAKDLGELKNYAGNIARNKIDTFINQLTIELAKLSVKTKGDKKFLESYVSKMKGVCNMLEGPRKMMANNIVVKNAEIDIQDYVSKLLKLNNSIARLEKIMLVDLEI